MKGEEIVHRISAVANKEGPCLLPSPRWLSGLLRARLPAPFERHRVLLLSTARCLPPSLQQLRRARLPAPFERHRVLLLSTARCLLPPAYCLLLTICCLLICCGQRDTRFQQYFAEGEQLYNTHCSNCHQKDGKGLGLVYPPLAPSDFMDKNFDEVTCLMKKGIKGEMMVNGIAYNQPMPGVPSLTELEIAEIATYIYNSWGHERGLIDVKQVNQSLQPCLSN